MPWYGSASMLIHTGTDACSVSRGMEFYHRLCFGSPTQGAVSMRSPILLLSALLICLAIGHVTDAASVFAATGGCRADPIVWLSNGTKITVTASSTAAASAVKMLTYTLHVPRGVKVTKVLYTGGVLKAKERVVVVADRTSGYQIATFADL